MKYGPLFGITDQLPTPEAVIEDIRRFESEGAHGVVINLNALERQYWNIESFAKVIDSGCKVESYACFYRSAATADLTDDERAKYLLMAAEAGADIVDVMGDMFDPQPGELTLDVQAVEKQKSLIAEIKKYGSTVLMSSHVKKHCPTEEAVKYFYGHCQRGVDITKVVFACNTQEELDESFRTSDELCRNCPKPFIHVCGGVLGHDVQRYETLFKGSIVTFVRCKENPVQPSVKEALAFLRCRAPWALQ